MRLNERQCWCDSWFISALHVINSALQLNALLDDELKVDVLVSDPDISVSFNFWTNVDANFTSVLDKRPEFPDRNQDWEQPSNGHCKAFPVYTRAKFPELEQTIPAAFLHSCLTVGKVKVLSFLCSVVKQKEHPCGRAALVSENN